MELCLNLAGSKAEQISSDASRDADAEIVVRWRMNNKNPLVFIHIPKTAGSSLVCDLEHVQGQALNIVDGLENSDKLVRNGEFKFITGHLWFGEWCQRFGDQYRFMTFLREPIKRVISEYFYVIGPKHSDPESAKALFPTLEAFIYDSHSHNRQYRQLRLSENESVSDIVDRLESFFFVGLVDSYRQDRNELLAKLGTPWPDLPRVNVGEYKYSDVTAQQRKLCRSFNELDFELYEAVKSRLSRTPQRRRTKVAA